MSSNSSYDIDEPRTAAYASFVHSTGRHLADSETAQLENDLAMNPADTMLRLKLLGYYKCQDSVGGSVRWIDHYQWFVSNCADMLLITYISRLPQRISGRQFQMLRAHWLEAIDKRPNDAKVAGHAADFIGQRDYQLAEELLTRAEKLAPHDSTWAYKLCYLYFQQARAACAAYHQEYADLAFVQADRALKAFKDGDGIGIAIELLMRMCDLAMECDNLGLARRYANRAIQIMDGGPVWLDRPYGRLGLIALREGDVELAKKHFLTSAKYGFNTDTRLLHELQTLGHSESIIKYLKICRREQHKTNSEDGQFDKWILAINRGLKPDFPIYEPR